MVVDILESTERIPLLLCPSDSCFLVFFCYGLIPGQSNASFLILRNERRTVLANLAKVKKTMGSKEKLKIQNTPPSPNVSLHVPISPYNSPPRAIFASVATLFLLLVDTSDFFLVLVQKSSSLYSNRSWKFAIQFLFAVLLRVIP